MNGIGIQPKCYTKEYLSENGHLIFKNRELIIEKEIGTDISDTTLRFKIGDGVTPYNLLKYCSSMYALFPKVIFYDENYTSYVSVDFAGEG